MKYYIVYKPNEKENKFFECNHENEMIKEIQRRKNAVLSDFDIYLKII